MTANRPSPRLPVPVLAILLAACGGANPADRGGSVCVNGGRFVADGIVPIDAAATGNASEVRALRWEAYPGCERVVIELAGRNGAPADFPGQVKAELIRDLGVLRISLMDVESVGPGATDAIFGGSLAGAAYSVWSPEGRWVYVDVHLAAEAEAHVSFADTPARIVADLRDGGGAVPAPPQASRRTVVLSPRPGEATYPLVVTGYARTFEANVVARIEQGGDQVAETFTTATSWVNAWGHYMLTIGDGPAGRIALHVGEYSARDGSWEGTVVELDMR